MPFLVIVEEGPESFSAYALVFHLEGLKAAGQAVPKPISSVETVEVQMK